MQVGMAVMFSIPAWQWEILIFEHYVYKKKKNSLQDSKIGAYL